MGQLQQKDYHYRPQAHIEPPRVDEYSSDEDGARLTFADPVGLGSLTSALPSSSPPASPSRKPILDDIAPAASMVMTEIQNVMICLSSQTNNMYDRDACDNLQVDFQIFLYLFQRIFRQSPGTLLQDSDSMILYAPNCITEAYAMQLISMPFESKDYLKYGTLVLRDITRMSHFFKTFDD